jgi:transposase-like protein
MSTKFNSLLTVSDYFKDENVCKEYLIAQRWNGKIKCPHCGCEKIYTTKRGYTCAEKTCAKKFSVTTGTVMENTKLPYRLWLMTIYLATAHKKGISSLQLGRDLNIPQKTAWFLLHRVREMFAVNEPELLTGTVEIDETFVGGKNKNRHANKKVKNSQGRSHEDKTPVVGLVQRGGNVMTFVTKDVDSVTLETIATSNIHQDANIITDAYRAYNGLNQLYNHTTVKHTENDYRTTSLDHTNTIEGFWSLLKRGIFGIYHQVSPKHLHRYCNEFGYRYNTKVAKDVARFEDAVTKIGNARLRYVDLVA